MWKFLIQRRLQHHIHRDVEIAPADISHASTVLFSVFARYGDSIIAFKVLNEFITAHPGKRYILITTPQMAPYARKILGGAIELHAVNKRRNPIRFLALTYMLSRTPIDIGFNPWSHGDDSRFFITFAEKFSFFESRLTFSKEYNLYDRVRRYLLMGKKGNGSQKWGQVYTLDIHGMNVKSIDLTPRTIASIVLCPFSTDRTKSLGGNDVDALVDQIKDRFPAVRFTIAIQKKERKNIRTKADLFVFGKNAKKSEAFLKLLESSDLFIGIDAGPLHLADALGMRAIGIFGPTAPETIMDRDSTIIPLRHARLNGTFCFVKQCRRPVCIEELFRDDFLLHRCQTDFNRKIVLVTETCPYAMISRNADGT